MNIRSWLLRSMGIILFTAILIHVDLGAVFSIMARTEPAVVTVVIIPILMIAVIRACRWQWLLKPISADMSYQAALRVTFSSMIWGMLTPARSGELVRVHDLIANRSIPLSKAVQMWILDMSMDLLAALIFVCGFVILGTSVFDQFLPLEILSVVMGATIVALLLVPAFSRRVINSKGFGGRTKSLSSAFAQLTALRMASAVALSLASFSAYAAAIVILTLHLFGLSWESIFLLTGITMLVGAIPITWMGFGTREAVLILLFQQMGRTAEEAVGFSLFFVLFALLSVVVYAAGLGIAGLVSRK